MPRRRRPLPLTGRSVPRRLSLPSTAHSWSLRPLNFTTTSRAKELTMTEPITQTQNERARTRLVFKKLVYDAFAVGD